jgi:hypothetical protein
MLLVTSGANKDSRPLITSQEIDEETAREIPGAGCTWYPDEQPLSNELSDCPAPRRSTVLEARPNTLALPATVGRGSGQTHSLAVCVTQVRVELFCDGNTVTLEGWYGRTWRLAG